MTGLPPTAENFRAEIARHRLTREAICDLIGMNVNLLSMYVNGVRGLPFWAKHNIGYGINLCTGIRIFNVDMERGVLDPIRPPYAARDPRKTVRLPTEPKRRRRKQKI